MRKTSAHAARADAASPALTIAAAAVLASRTLHASFYHYYRIFYDVAIMMQHAMVMAGARLPTARRFRFSWAHIDAFYYIWHHEHFPPPYADAQASFHSAISCCYARK